MKTLRTVLSVFLIPAFLLGNVTYAQDAYDTYDDESVAADKTAKETVNETFTAAIPSTLNLVVGDIETITVKNLTRVSVTNPDVADISDAQSTNVMILAKKPGQTALFVWDEAGKHTIAVRVTLEDMDMLKDRVAHLLAGAEIKGLNLEASAAEGKIILSGRVYKEKRATLERVLEPYADQIINLVEDAASEDLIQIDMQITELSSTLDKSLGIDWGTDNLEYTETDLPSGGANDWFKFGKFNRTTAIVNAVNLMIRDGRARDLSRPRLLVTSGKEATINVGGEVPIQSTTTNSAGGSLVQQNVTFKQYGVTLTVTPTVKDGKIDVVMNIQVSDVDKTFFITATDTSDIAYKTRSAQTQLFLDDRQTVVFAGLIRYNDSDVVKRVPVLGKLPLVGGLFRHKSKQAPDEGKELVITMTPTIMRKKEYVTEQVKMPTESLKAFEQEVDSRKGYIREAIDATENKAPQVIKAPAMVEPKSSGNVPLPAPALAPGLSAASAATSDVTASTVTGTPVPYVRSIQMKISQAISYPYEAIKNNWEGTVKLKLRISRNGALTDAQVSESSGHDVFDTDALNTAKIVAPFGPFTSDISGQELVVTVPIVYSQNSSAKTETQTVVSTY
jgi:pilus assembly protein CpaC